MSNWGTRFGDVGHRSGLGRFGAVLLASILGLALAAGSASADTRHPVQTMEFGTNGTELTKFNETMKSVAYDQKHNRLYVLTGPIGSTEKGKVYGFDNPSQGVYTPRAGFPVSVPAPYFNPRITVDDSDGPNSGRVYYVGQHAGAGMALHAIEPNGQMETTSWPVKFSGEPCDADVDPEGNLWVSFRFNQTLIKLASGDGSQLGEFPLGFTTCSISFDPDTGDLFAQRQGFPDPEGFFRLTKESDYQTRFGPFATSNFLGFNSNGINEFDFDGATDRLYVARRYFRQDESSYFDYIHALTPDGKLIEEFAEHKSSNNFEEEYVGVAVNEDNGDVHVADNTAPTVVRLFSTVVVPDVVTGEQTANDQVSGTIDRAEAGEITECFFEYATDEFFDNNGETYDQQIPCDPPAPFDEDRSVTATIPGLVDETAYHYRLVAANADGQGAGVDRILEPHAVDFLKTRPATEVERETATLNASFNGNGEDTTYYFQWGIDEGQAGDVEENESDPVTLTAPAGLTEVSEPVADLTAGTTYRFRVIAEVGGNESVAQALTFRTPDAIKDIQTLPATGIEPSQATLNGSLDPDGYDTTYYFEYGKTKAYGQSVPIPPGDPVGTSAPGVVEVSTLATNLEPGTTYHFRIVGVNQTGNTKGLDQVFTTPQGPSINSFSSRNVTATSAELTGQIDPNGFEIEEAYFEYGTTLEYGSIAPVPADQFEGAEGPHNVVVAITGLQGVTYHFRLVAKNEWGETFTEDQTFDFYAPEGCPNHGVRQQTGAAYLPDCRAYELVSPRRGGGALLSPRAPHSPHATSPGRFAFEAAGNAIPDSGEPSNSGFTSGDLYVASRTLSGWTTRYAGIPGSRSLAYAGAWNETFFHRLLPIFTDTGMNKFLIWDRKQTGDTTGGDLEGTNAPYIYDNQGNELVQVPTNVDEVPGSDLDLTEGGFVGASRPSGDFSHYFFSTKDLVFDDAGLGRTTEPGSVYDNDIEADTVTVISKTEDGADIPRDVAGKANEYMRIPAVSRDGTHVLMSTEAAPEGSGPDRVHLYMAVNRGDHYDHYEVSEGQDDLNHGVFFEGMVDDGSVVYFTTADQMTPDDTDSVTDLYRWTEDGNEVTRVSTGSAGTGNSSTCGAVSCAVQVVPNGHDFDYSPQAFNRDTVLATDTGDIYFYSAEQLDGSRGIVGKQNLFVARADGTVQYAATFEPSSAPTRMNVSPDGRHMAMLTQARLTSFDNANIVQMYHYNAETREIQCVSCPPSGAPATTPVQASQNGLFMTADGRTFFATKEALIPRDANGILDVYEFVDGRPQLISTGAGDNEGNPQSVTGQIGLVGVSVDGTDVFFSTRETLVPEDENGSFQKFYDARTNGGFAVAKEPAPCAAADECHGPESVPPAQPVIGTGANLGQTGNARPQRKKARKKARCNRKSTKGKSRKRKSLKRKAAKRCAPKKRRSGRSKRGGRRG